MNKVNLRQLIGYDEQYLQEMPDDISLNSRVSRLFERIIVFEGVNKEDTRSILSKLSIGDRVALLLHIRQLLLGDIIKSTITCPKCKQNMSLELSVKSLLQIKYPEPEEYYDLKACGFNLQVRPLTGFEQETNLSSSSVDSNEDKLLEELVRVCVVHSDPPLPDLLPKSLIEAIGKKMEEIDPLSDITLAMSCIGCSHAFFPSFPVEEYIFSEIGLLGRGGAVAISGGGGGVSLLDQEVHLLAFNYHWTEKDILSIPTGRRKRYVKLGNFTESTVRGAEAEGEG
jgi:hypothetical protein